MLKPFPILFLLYEYSHVSPPDVSLHRGSLLPPCSWCTAVSPTRLLVSGQGRVPLRRVRPRLPPYPQDGVEGSLRIPFLKKSAVITRVSRSIFI